MRHSRQKEIKPSSLNVAAQNTTITTPHRSNTEASFHTSTKSVAISRSLSSTIPTKNHLSGSQNQRHGSITNISRQPYHQKAYTGLRLNRNDSTRLPSLFTASTPQNVMNCRYFSSKSYRQSYLEDNYRYNEDQTPTPEMDIQAVRMDSDEYERLMTIQQYSHFDPAASSQQSGMAAYLQGFGVKGLADYNLGNAPLACYYPMPTQEGDHDDDDLSATSTRRTRHQDVGSAGSDGGDDGDDGDAIPQAQDYTASFGHAIASTYKVGKNTAPPSLQEGHIIVEGNSKNEIYEKMDRVMTDKTSMSQPPKPIENMSLLSSPSSYQDATSSHDQDLHLPFLKPMSCDDALSTLGKMTYDQLYTTKPLTPLTYRTDVRIHNVNLFRHVDGVNSQLARSFQDMALYTSALFSARVVFLLQLMNNHSVPSSSILHHFVNTIADEYSTPPPEVALHLMQFALQTERYGLVVAIFRHAHEVNLLEDANTATGNSVSDELTRLLSEEATYVCLDAISRYFAQRQTIRSRSNSFDGFPESSFETMNMGYFFLSQLQFPSELNGKSKKILDFYLTCFDTSNAKVYIERLIQLIPIEERCDNYDLTSICNRILKIHVHSKQFPESMNFLQWMEQQGVQIDRQTNALLALLFAENDDESLSAFLTLQYQNGHLDMHLINTFVAHLLTALPTHNEHSVPFHRLIALYKERSPQLLQNDEIPTILSRDEVTLYHSAAHKYHHQASKIYSRLVEQYPVEMQQLEYYDKGFILWSDRLPEEISSTLTPDERTILHYYSQTEQHIHATQLDVHEYISKPGREQMADDGRGFMKLRARSDSSLETQSSGLSSYTTVYYNYHQQSTNAMQTDVMARMEAPPLNRHQLYSAARRNGTFLHHSRTLFGASNPTFNPDLPLTEQERTTLARCLAQAEVSPRVAIFADQAQGISRLASIFDLIKHTGLYPDRVTFALLINAANTGHHHDLVLRLFNLQRLSMIEELPFTTFPVVLSSLECNYSQIAEQLFKGTDLSMSNGPSLITLTRLALESGNFTIPMQVLKSLAESVEQNRPLPVAFNPTVVFRLVEYTLTALSRLNTPESYQRILTIIQMLQRKMKFFIYDSSFRQLSNFYSPRDLTRLLLIGVKAARILNAGTAEDVMRRIITLNEPDFQHLKLKPRPPPEAPKRGRNLANATFKFS